MRSTLIALGFLAGAAFGDSVYPDGYKCVGADCLEVSTQKPDPRFYRSNLEWVKGHELDVSSMERLGTPPTSPPGTVRNCHYDYNVPLKLSYPYQSLHSPRQLDFSLSETCPRYVYYVVDRTGAVAVANVGPVTLGNSEGCTYHVDKPLILDFQLKWLTGICPPMIYFGVMPKPLTAN